MTKKAAFITYLQQRLTLCVVYNVVNSVKFFVVGYEPARRQVQRAF